jgi:hypothetical protein
MGQRGAGTVSLTRASLAALAVAMLGAAPAVRTVQPLAVGSFAVSQFVASGGNVVHVEAAVFPRDRVTIRVVDRPLGGPPGQIVLRAMEPQVLAAIDGGYFTQGFVPNGLYEIGGVVRQPARSRLSGVVGSAKDGTPVVDWANTIDVAAMRDAMQSSPFVVDPGGVNGIRRDDGSRQRRSLVVVSTDSIVFVTTSACGLYDLAKALVTSPQTFGVERVDRALNLGGGPSAGFAVRLPSNDMHSVPETIRIRTVLTIEERT